MLRSGGVEISAARPRQRRPGARAPSASCSTSLSEVMAPSARPPSGAPRIAAQLRDAAQADHARRRLLAPLHVRIEVGAAGDDHRVAARARRGARRLVDRARREVLEPRQAHHDGFGSSARRAARRAARRRPRTPIALARRSSIALPSPPSHGGGTTSGFGHAIAGKRVGPKRLLRLAERLQDLLRRDRHLVDAHADRVVDRVGDRRHHRQQRPLARLPWRRTGPSGPAPR